MLLTRLVVLGGAALQALAKLLGREVLLHPPRHHLLDQVQKRAAVAVGHVDELLARGTVQRQRPVQFAFGPLGEVFEVDRRKTFQNDDLRARQKGGVQFEAGVFGGGPHQNDRPILHVGKEAVLLRLVETVDLVHEQKRSPLPVLHAQFRRLEHLPQVGDAGEDRADLDEGELCLLRQKAGDGGLAHAGRPPEDERAERACGQHRPHRAVGAQDVTLPDHIGQTRGAQPVCQRAGGLRGGGGWGVEQVGHGPTIGALG